MFNLINALTVLDIALVGGVWWAAQHKQWALVWTLGAVAMLLMALLGGGRG